MSILRVNPTRMELTRLKKKLNTARRGHKLLKDKQDELMRIFLDLVRETKDLRESVEKNVLLSCKSFVIARSVMKEEILKTSMLVPKKRVKISVDYKNVMSVKLPKFTCYNELIDKVEDFSDNENMLSYGYAFTSGDLDEAICLLSSTFKDMILLAEKEKSSLMLASEIEKTRRRVNALEHVMIPDLMDTIKSITMKLDENERSNTTRLMKIKDMMLEANRH